MFLPAQRGQTPEAGIAEWDRDIQGIRVGEQNTAPGLGFWERLGKILLFKEKIAGL